MCQLNTSMKRPKIDQKSLLAIRLESQSGIDLAFNTATFGFLLLTMKKRGVIVATILTGYCELPEVMIFTLFTL